MQNQKNLFLAIGLSVAIIVIFQLLVPQQTMMTPPTQQTSEEIGITTSIDQTQKIESPTIQTKEEIIMLDNRVLISTPLLKGSINLKGAILDDLILLNYKESLDKNSNNINLFYPDKTSNPYFIEIGWKSLSNNSIDIDLPDSETKWKTTSGTLSSSSPITLYWTNKDSITFKIYFEVDCHIHYIFESYLDNYAFL